MGSTTIDGSPFPEWSERDADALLLEIDSIERKLHNAPELGGRALRMAVFNPSVNQSAPMTYGADPFRRFNFPGLN